MTSSKPSSISKSVYVMSQLPTTAGSEQTAIKAYGESIANISVESLLMNLRENIDPFL
jgi:hypothetical protein